MSDTLPLEDAKVELLSRELTALAVAYSDVGGQFSLSIRVSDCQDLLLRASKICYSEEYQSFGSADGLRCSNSVQIVNFRLTAL